MAQTVSRLSTKIGENWWSPSFEKHFNEVGVVKLLFGSG